MRQALPWIIAPLSGPGTAPSLTPASARRDRTDLPRGADWGRLAAAANLFPPIGKVASVLRSLRPISLEAGSRRLYGTPCLSCSFQRSGSRAGARSFCHRRTCRRSGRGLPAHLGRRPGENGSCAIPATRPAIRRGFVKVDARPAALRSTGCSPRCTSWRTSGAATICARRSFDNYRLDQTKPETTGRGESAHPRRQAFTARRRRACPELRHAFLATLAGADLRQRFRSSTMAATSTSSAFEHVAVGEQKAARSTATTSGTSTTSMTGRVPGQDDIDYDGSRYDGPHRREGN